MRVISAAEVEAALLDLRTGAELQSMATQQLELAQTEVDQARRRFEEGIAGNLELINAQASLVRARDAVIAAEATRAALSNAEVEFVLLAECGHFWHECPDQVYDHVRTFLEASAAE